MYLNNPDSWRYWAICVVLPLPVSPTMIVVGLFFTDSMICLRYLYTGRLFRSSCNYP